MHEHSKSGCRNPSKFDAFRYSTTICLIVRISFIVVSNHKFLFLDKSVACMELNQLQPYQVFRLSPISPISCGRHRYSQNDNPLVLYYASTSSSSSSQATSFFLILFAFCDWI